MKFILQRDHLLLLLMAEGTGCFTSLHSLKPCRSE
ncbi:MAG: hypothetical protein ACD_5C00008G0019, partial [uncultured bacterium]